MTTDLSTCRFLGRTLARFATPFNLRVILLRRSKTRANTDG